MRQLLLATMNQHKIRELRALLADVPAELVTLDQFPSCPAPVEDQDSLEGNAMKKAREVFRQTNVPTLADDSGLEVDYLNKAPGVYSSRYAGPDATYADNCRKLLHELRGVPPRRRGARFRCVLAFIGSSEVERMVEGVCSGVIIEAPRGDKGFGYDPLFVPNDFRETLAQMDISLKNKLSHRAKAIQLIQPTLLGHFTRLGT